MICDHFVANPATFVCMGFRGRKACGLHFSFSLKQSVFKVLGAYSHDVGNSFVFIVLQGRRGAGGGWVSYLQFAWPLADSWKSRYAT